MADLALIQMRSPVASLVLNRSDARNALSLDLLNALHARLDELERAEDAHVLVVTGTGKAFCAGMDLKQVMGEPDAARELLRSLARLTLRIRRLPMVVLAKVNGAAIGGGCGLACVCDLAVTHADSKMGFPEVDLGLCPAVVAPWVVRRVGAGRARQILLEGGLLDGRRAHAQGLVTQLVETLDDLDPAVDRLADSIAQGGPKALRATKTLLNELDGSLDEDLLMRGADLSASVLATDDAQARLRARFEKQ